MSPIENRVEEPARSEACRRLWQRCQGLVPSPDETERFLDLAGLVDGTIEDEDECARVGALVTADPVARSDIAAARGLASGGIAMTGGLERIVERATALVADAGTADRIVVLGPPPRRARLLRGAARWTGLAAAIAVTSWLGFTMGSDASLSLGTAPPVQPQQISEEGFLPELLDPSTGFLRDFGEGQQT
jgi:hypothetical protein